MKLFSRRYAYTFALMIALLLPPFGYLIDFTYKTGYKGFVLCTLTGIIVFIVVHVRQKKTQAKKDSRAVDWLSTGCTLQIAGNHREAIIALSKACESDPGVVLAYFARGRSYSELGNFDQAIKDFDKSIELNPRFVEAFDKRGQCYSKVGNHVQSIKDFDMAIELNPKFAPAYINRAAEYEMTGNIDQSIMDYQAAARIGNEGARNILKAKGIEW